MRRLVLVRHGESTWNAERRVQGQRCAGLSDLGHEQARTTAAVLVRSYPEARLVSSDIRRAEQTAAPLAEALGGELVTDVRLRERSFGEWEARTPTELESEDPDRWRRWTAGEDVVGEVGGETRHELARRVVPVLVELLDATPDAGTTIVITHGGPVWHGTHRLLGLAPGTLGGLANTSLTELVRADTVHDGAAGSPVVMERWNEVGHLPLELRTAWRPRVLATSPAVVGP